MDWIALILSVIALLPLVAFLARWLFFTPKISIRVGGEQGGEPIQVPERGNVYFAVSTTSKYRVFISEVWVAYDDDPVDLSQTKGAEERITTDSRFLTALFFSERRA